MDYANQRRLKILGRVRVISEDDEPEIVAALTPPGYPARAEHAFVIQVEAYDWNCPQHITPRLTREEWDVLGISAPAPLAAPAAAAPTDVWGDGPLALVVSGVRQLATRVRAYELRAVDGGDLPPVGAGSHLDVPVRLADGRTLTRSYSIASNPARRDIYEIAVQREEAGRGGSRAIHASLQLGQQLNLAPPRNHFALHSDARPALLIAGGIGITPLKAMAQSLLRDGREFALHYIGRSAAEMPYLDRLRRCLGERMHAWMTRQAGAAPLDLATIVEGAGDAAVIYVCGPRRLVDEVRRLGIAAGIAAERIIDESFA